jgi:hypothetical protein
MYINNINIYIFFLVASITPDDMKCMCGLVDGANTIKQLPPGCKTAVVTVGNAGYF